MLFSILQCQQLFFCSLIITVSYKRNQISPGSCPLGSQQFIHLSPSTVPSPRTVSAASNEMQNAALAQGLGMDDNNIYGTGWIVLHSTLRFTSERKGEHSSEWCWLIKS